MFEFPPAAELVKLRAPTTPLVSLDGFGQRQRAFQSGPTLSHLIRVLLRQKWKLATFVVLAMAATVVLQFTLTKLYEATAQVKVDRHSAPGVLGTEASQVSAVDDMDQIITTHEQLVQSDPVLRPVAEKFNLWEEERQLTGLKPQDIDRKTSAPVTLSRLKVSRPPNTYLISISYRATNPQLASDVANDVATSLVNHSRETANRPYIEISNLIATHMAELRAKMERTAQKLVEDQKNLNIVDPRSHTTMLMARLDRLNTEFTNTQTERLQKEGVLTALLSKPSVAAAQAAEPPNQPSLLHDALQRADLANQQFSAARSYYGENHPDYLKAKEQLEDAQVHVNEARNNASERAKADYEQALGRENTLRAMIEETKVEVGSQSRLVLEYERLQSEAERDKLTYDDLEKRNEQADVNDHFREATVQLVAPARPPYAPIFPKLSVNLPVAFILSAFLGILAVVLADSLDNTFSDPEEIASRFNIDVLASIPAVRQLPPVRTSGPGMIPQSSEGRNAEMTLLYSEAIRILRNTISLSSLEKPIHTLLVTSANPSEGKSTTSVHLSLALAQLGKRVLLIDADMRRPAIHKQFGISGETGLSEILTQAIPFGDALVQIDDSDLYVLPAGPVTQHASDLISVGFASVLAKVSRDFDFIVVDGPPVLGLAETQEMASMVDGVLLVAKAASTTGKSLADAMSEMLRVRAHILGIAMNQVKSSHAGYGYGYGYSNRSLPSEKSAKKA